MSMNDNRPLKTKFFSVKKFSFINSDFKKGIKMNLRIKTKNHAADKQIGFLTKPIS